jgi:hypothetical protein
MAGNDDLGFHQKKLLDNFDYRKLALKQDTWMAGYLPGFSLLNNSQQLN